MNSQYEFYNELCGSYVNANTLENTNTLSLTYTNPDAKPNGFVFTIILAIVAIAIGLIVIILMNM